MRSTIIFYLAILLCSPHFMHAQSGAQSVKTSAVKKSLSGRLPAYRPSREEMMTHVVTHGGYHRGEIGRILVQIGVTPPWDTFAVHLHQTEPSRRLQVIREPVGV